MTNVKVSITTKNAVLPPSGLVRVRVVWDDENPDWNYKSRTLDPGFIGPPAPPAVMRFYPPLPDGSPPIKDKPGDFRVMMDAPYNWRPQKVVLNGGGDEGKQRVEYLTGNRRATYNKPGGDSSGWAYKAYITMSGNILEGEFVNSINPNNGQVLEWFRFKTLVPSDLSRVAGWTTQSHPHLVHKFTCVKFKDGETIHIESTGTPRGKVYYYLVTNEGVAHIPARHVVEL